MSDESASPPTNPLPEPRETDGTDALKAPGSGTITLQFNPPPGIVLGGLGGLVPGLQGAGIYAPMMAQLPPAIMQTHWQGPFPPPDAVERFERVQPGAFNRILAMAENLQAAQIKQSADALKLHHADVSRAQWLAFGGVLASMIGAAVSTYFGHDVIAGIFLSLPVMGVIKALVDSARGQKPVVQSADIDSPAANTPSNDANPDVPAPS